MKEKVIYNLPALAPTLRGKVKAYKNKVGELERALAARPAEWGRYQSEFNQEINGIFRDLMNFERENVASGKEDRVYKLKQLFVEWFRKDFVRGEYLKWSLEKPFGYAGDFKIIDDIYQNSPKTTGFDRLYDNYFQMSTICSAVRNRKEDFKRLLLKFLETRKGNSAKPIKVMDLASGPGREVFEILSNPAVRIQNAKFHCYENDPRAIDYAKRLIGDDKQVEFFQQNAVRLALKKDLDTSLQNKYDFIYSTGLFDYLDTRISIRLINNLRKLLKEGGVIAISDVRDKFSNPSLYFMEWVADWSLVYREDDSFRGLFVEAGFSEKDLRFEYEQQGVMQYVIADKNNR